MKYRLTATCFALPLVFGITGCGGGDPAAPDGESSVEALLIRDRTAVHASAGLWARARTELEPLVTEADSSAEDLARAATIELQAGQPAAARAFVDRALALDAKHPAALYLDGRLKMLLTVDFEAASEVLRATLEVAPEDLATRVLLGECLEYVAEDAEEDEVYLALLTEARDLFQEIEQVGMENGGAWYVTAIYKLTQLEDVLEPAQVERYVEMRDDLLELGLEAANNTLLNEGGLASVRPATPTGNRGVAPQAPTYERAGTGPSSLAGAARLGLHDMDGDRRNDLVTSGPRGLVVSIAGDDGGYTAVPVRSEATGPFAAVDLNRDDDWDLIWAAGDEVGLVEFDEGVWNARHGVSFPSLPGEVHDLVAVDYDHEGDLDLLLVGTFGARLWRNDGAGRLPEADPDAPRGAFVDATEGTGLPTSGELTWCATEDLDNDQDVDLVVGGPAGTFVLSSDRGGRFTDVSDAVLGGATWAREPVLADLDGDSRPDAFVPDAGAAALWVQAPDGSLSRRPLDVAVPEGATPFECDLDLDGIVDVAWNPAGALLEGVLAVGLTERVPFTLAGDASGPCALGDVDYDPTNVTDVRPELVRIGPDGCSIWRTEDPGGAGAKLRYWGDKDNRQAIGAIVEVRVRDRYRRVHWRGDQQVIGLGSHGRADVVRVTWPNGVVNNRLDLEPGDQIAYVEGTDIQQGNLIGSCPFLYTWNGETYEFISDVLGITPLGLPMAPGLLVPPDHDEYVLVRGDQLVPRDGFLELQFTEELREVTYLDRVRLDVVDHPAGTEVHPNERFTFPPFPEPHVHTLRDPLSPTRVTGSDGQDWTAALGAIDGQHASPFEPIGGQYMGMAPHHHLELHFDPERTEGASRLRLACTGWFFWSDASVNMATARTPGLDFVPPMLEVPDGQGGWKVAGPPLGFPAGKTKTMVVDVTGMVDPADPRMRISSTLRLYWDAIRLAVDDDDAERRVTSIEPVSARLWERGFSAPIFSDAEDQPERFEWERLADVPRWDQHPGRYTRFGECEPLLHEVDDRFVILGSGDCLTIRFAAEDLPPVPEGFVRDYLVFFDGWAKDRDPNTVEALEVEPLPFHGMSGYPYGPDEAFPDTEAHRAWREAWNTRPGRRLIPPVSPRAWDERFGGQ